MEVGLHDIDRIKPTATRKKTDMLDVKRPKEVEAIFK